MRNKCAAFLLVSARAGGGGGAGVGLLFYREVHLFLRDAKLLLRDCIYKLKINTSL